MQPFFYFLFEKNKKQGAAGVLLDKTKAFLPMIRITFLCATGTFVLFALANKPDNNAMLAVASGAMGLFCFAVYA